MRWLAALTFALCAVPLHAEDKTKGPLAEARTRWLTGNYAEARDLYAAKLKDETLRAEAACGLARTHVSEGNFDKTAAVLDAALKIDEDDPHLLAAKADLLYQFGQWDDALKLAERVIKTKDGHFLARWVRARILRDRGDMKEADREMRWFVRKYSERSEMDADIKDPDELLIVGQAGTENARWHSLSDQFAFILNEIYVDTIKIEPNCWMAEYLAGAMLLEKMNLPEAVKAFDKALAINPAATEAIVGKGRASLINFDFKNAELYAEQALKSNHHLPVALRLRADVYSATGEINKAFRALEEAREINERDEATLARVAACQYELKNIKDFERTIAEVQKFNPKPGVFYGDLASALEDRKHYADSEKFYKLAMDLNDKLAGPKSALGLLYLRLGKEAEAKELLDKAFAFDPFNVRVANSRKVLKHLTAYETKESKHYRLRFDPKTDRVLAEFVLDYLEEIHAQLAKDFNFEPEGKILVEVFNNHEMFSGRTVALPDLHTIGACTGRVVTMVSPHGKGLGRTFNWGRVIRHELVHIFNLAQTDFQVPHWLTEGLAVRNEGGAKPPSWQVYLRERFAKNDLFNLDTVLLGFVRPKSSDEWSLAYYQSNLYVEYLIKTHGIEAVGKMLDAYHNGLDTRAAIQKVCGIDQAEFEKGYRGYLTNIVKAIPAPAHPKEKAKTLTELEQAHEQKPDDADIAAKLAAEYLRRKQAAEAKKLAEEVLETDKGHPVASVVKAKLLIAGGDKAAARKLIESAIALHENDVRLRSYLGKLCLDAKEFGAAAEQFEQCRKLDPLSGDWLKQLRDLYEKLEDNAKLLDALNEITAGDADDLPSRKQLAKLLFDAKKYAEAETVARDAIQIDVLDEEARKLLLDSLRKQNKDDEADKIAKRYEKE